MDLDIQVSKLKLMKANHTSQKYKLEDNIAKHYPQQIAILKERIEGMEYHALESMPKQLSEAQTKLETVQRQLETAKAEVTKPFAQEAEKLERVIRLKCPA